MSVVRVNTGQTVLLPKPNLTEYSLSINWLSLISNTTSDIDSLKYADSCPHCWLFLHIFLINDYHIYQSFLLAFFREQIFM